MTTAKIVKDVRTLSDLVLMGEIANAQKAIAYFQGNLTILEKERDSRLAAAATSAQQDLPE
jgi:hypothetical protein